MNLFFGLFLSAFAEFVKKERLEFIIRMNLSLARNVYS